MVMNTFRGTPNEYVIKMMQLDTPATITENILCAFMFYLATFIGGYLCLRYLYKERR
jgi:hypothetical protein